MTPCHDLPRYIAGTLDDAEHDDFTSHLPDCEPCQLVVEADCAKMLRHGQPRELQAFYDHLDVCARCRNKPMDLCNDGARLQRVAAETAAQDVTGKRAPRVPRTIAALAVALVAAAGCDEAACIRQSDCPAPPTDDAGADGGDGGAAAVVGDLGPGLCTVALRCEVFAAWGERAKQCEGALAPDQVAKVHNELACVIAGCPIDCATQLNNVELRDPAACWGCASQKLGNLCVVECP